MDVRTKTQLKIGILSTQLTREVTENGLVHPYRRIEFWTFFCCLPRWSMGKVLRTKGLYVATILCNVKAILLPPQYIDSLLRYVYAV